MVRNTIICDCCGKEIDRGYMVDVRHIRTRLINRLDICSDCHEFLSNVINASEDIKALISGMVIKEADEADA